VSRETKRDTKTIADKLKAWRTTNSKDFSEKPEQVMVANDVTGYSKR
jgi:hypothetical protein